jgi:putative ABC transport system substrate-binding protein
VNVSIKFNGFALGAMLFALCPVADAQPAAKIPWTGFGSGIGPQDPGPQVSGFRQGLRSLGYVDGKNILVEHRYAAGKSDRIPGLVAELEQLKVDVLVVGTTQAILAAKQATKTIPIVMVTTQDPVAAGFVDSLARPGGNITGLTQISAELGGERLELLKDAFPKVSSVGVFVNTTLPAQQMLESLQQTQMAADALGVKLLSLEVRAPNPDFDGAFRTAKSERVGALLIAPSPVLNLHRKRVADLSVKTRLPAMCPESEFVEVGGLMSYGVDYTDLYRRTATFVDKILKGAKVPELPVEQPTKFEFVINLKTAKALKLTIPQSVLYRADSVIK